MLVGDVLVPSPGLFRIMIALQRYDDFCKQTKKKLSNIKSTNFVRKRVVFKPSSTPAGIKKPCSRLMQQG